MKPENTHLVHSTQDLTWWETSEKDLNFIYQQILTRLPQEGFLFQ